MRAASAANLQSAFIGITQLLGHIRETSKKRKLAETIPDEQSSNENRLLLTDWCESLFRLTNRYSKNQKFTQHFLLALQKIIVPDDTDAKCLDFHTLFPRDYPPQLALELYGIKAKVGKRPAKRPTYDLYAKGINELYSYVENITWAILADWYRRKCTPECQLDNKLTDLLVFLGGAARVNPAAGFVKRNTSNTAQCRHCKCVFEIGSASSQPEEKLVSALQERSNESLSESEELVEAPPVAELDLSPINWDQYSNSRECKVGTDARACADPTSSEIRLDATPTAPTVRMERELFVLDDNIRWLKKTRTFCSAGCQYLHIISASGQIIRQRLEVRDGTRCANCDVNAKEIFDLYKKTCATALISATLNHKTPSEESIDLCVSIWHEVSPWDDDNELGATNAIGKKIFARLNKKWFMEMFRRKRYGLQLGDLWQADHILPVKLGGGSTIFNIRTLCARCHRSVTRHLAKYTFTEHTSIQSVEDGSPYTKCEKRRRVGMKRWYGKV